MNMRQRSQAIGILALLAMGGLAGCNLPNDLGPVANARSADEIRTALKSASTATDDDSAEAVTGTGWATIKGRFVYYDSVIPQMPPYNVTKEPEICTDHGTPPPQEFLLVDSGSKGIKNIALYLRDVKRVHDEAKIADGEAVFDQKECVFLSHVFPVAVGQPIDIKNSDPTGHNTKIGGRMNFNQTIPAGQSIRFTPQKEEATPVQVTCSIHPWMLAYILPRENKYFALTAEDGAFEIPNVPAGEPIEIQVWHENATNSSGLVINTPEAKALKWTSKGRFTVTIPEGETLDLGAISVPASAFKYKPAG